MLLALVAVHNSRWLHVAIIPLVASVDGGWGAWAFWSGCSVTCGGGVRSRSRSCDTPSPKGAGLACLRDDGSRTLMETKTEVCSNEICPGKKEFLDKAIIGDPNLFD